MGKWERRPWDDINLILNPYLASPPHQFHIRTIMASRYGVFCAFRICATHMSLNLLVFCYCCSFVLGVFCFFFSFEKLNLWPHAGKLASTELHPQAGLELTLQSSQASDLQVLLSQPHTQVARITGLYYQAQARLLFKVALQCRFVCYCHLGTGIQMLEEISQKLRGRFDLRPIRTLQLYS